MAHELKQSRRATESTGVRGVGDLPSREHTLIVHRVLHDLARRRAQRYRVAIGAGNQAHRTGNKSTLERGLHDRLEHHAVLDPS